jgi:hypothetical protein
MPNIIFGLTVLFITAVMGGMTLGVTFNDQSINDGFHLLTLERFYLREGHSHGNFMCLYNLFVGILLNNLNLSEILKTVASYAAMAAILLPIGLAWKGALGGIVEPPPVAIIGILGVAVSLGIMVFGAWRTRSPQIAD